MIEIHIRLCRAECVSCYMTSHVISRSMLNTQTRRCITNRHPCSLQFLSAAICRYPWFLVVSHSLLTRPFIGLKTLACDNYLRQLVNDCSFLSVLQCCDFICDTRSNTSNKATLERSRRYCMVRSTTHGIETDRQASVRDNLWPIPNILTTFSGIVKYSPTLTCKSTVNKQSTYRPHSRKTSYPIAKRQSGSPFQ